MSNSKLKIELAKVFIRGEAYTEEDAREILSLTKSLKGYEEVCLDLSKMKAYNEKFLMALFYGLHKKFKKVSYVDEYKGEVLDTPRIYCNFFDDLKPLLGEEAVEELKEGARHE